MSLLFLPAHIEYLLVMVIQLHAFPKLLFRLFVRRRQEALLGQQNGIKVQGHFGHKAVVVFGEPPHMVRPRLSTSCSRFGAFRAAKQECFPVGTFASILT